MTKSMQAAKPTAKIVATGAAVKAPKDGSGVAKEVDFVQEARSQARVTSLLARNRASIIVPALHPALGASAGLVSDGGGVVNREGTRGEAGCMVYCWLA